MEKIQFMILGKTHNLVPGRFFCYNRKAKMLKLRWGRGYKTPRQLGILNVNQLKVINFTYFFFSRFFFSLIFMIYRAAGEVAGHPFQRHLDISRDIALRTKRKYFLVLEKAKLLYNAFLTNQLNYAFVI